MTETLIDEQQLQVNSDEWARNYPKEALFLPYHDDEKLFFCRTEKSELNLQDMRRGNFFYHAPTGALHEAEQWFRSLNLNNVDVLFVFGVGLGYYYQAAKEWLHSDEKRSLVFMEDDLAVINRFFQTETAAELLKDPQARVHYFASLDDDDRSFVPLYWDYLRGNAEVSALASYNNQRHERYEDLKHKLIYDLTMKNAAIDEYMKFGYRFLLNFFPNLLTIADSYRATQLFGRFKGIPAIICGAGPSLKKNIDRVAECKEQAIIIAGGSAMNALNARDILPHFGVGIDPNPAQVDRLKTNKAEGVPFFYRNRMHKEAYRLIKGPRLYVPGAGGYDIANWFDEKFGLDSDEWLDEGHNVVNFSIELARAMGCNPIILVGVDLAFTGEQIYAEGVVDDVSYSEENAQVNLSNDVSLMKKDIYGQPIRTLWKWVAEAKWTGEYAKEHPEVTIINATEGGLGMPGISNIDFAEVQTRYLDKNYPLLEKIENEIRSAAIDNITSEDVRAAIEELREGLERCIEQITVLIDDNERLCKEVESTHTVPEKKQSGLAALAETELAEEPAYTEHLSIFNEVASRLLSKQLSGLRKSGKAEWEQVRDKCALNAMKLKFLSDAAKAAIETIDLSLI
ncbi:MAG: motility associated factor glycosyltransferase family protein [Chlamydiales bacterium]|nr:motility associated factor glycosyltransferase family protein [Chlamydiia bacterium]MCP5506984.1 motility associated factor glycosyltransferase family protein [Chlamydiales bacterium]